jgi:hypothetical protein
MTKLMKRVFEILCLIWAIGGGVYGMVAHRAYGVGIFIGGIFGASFGLVAAVIVTLLVAVLISAACSGTEPGMINKESRKAVKEAE